MFSYSAFGKVYVAMDKKSNILVAIKQIVASIDDKDVERESQILKECNSPYIVRYYNIVNSENELWVGVLCLR